MRRSVTALVVLAASVVICFACTDLGGLSGPADAVDGGAPGDTDGGGSVPAPAADAATDASAVDASAIFTPGVHCGSFDCDAGLRCCYDNPATCASSCPNGPTEYECDEPGDCAAGQVCCAKLIGGMVAGSECGSACGARLCSLDAHCLSPTTCKSLGTPFPPGIASCR